MDHTDEQIERYVIRKRDKENTLKVVLIEPRPSEETLTRLIEVCNRFSGFFIPYGRVDLSRPQEIDINKLFDIGSVGIKFICPYKDYDDECYFPLYEKAEELNMPILFHTGIIASLENEPRKIRGVSSARMKPEMLDTIARAFPELIIQGAHLGNPWYEISLEIMRYNRNIYWDLSGTTLTKKMTADWWTRIQWEKQSRKQFLYGTDECSLLPEDGEMTHYTTGREVHESFVERIGWTEEEQEGYFYKNALSLFEEIYKKQKREFVAGIQ